MTRKGFYFNMATCVGCKTCQIACKDRNGLEVGMLFRHVNSYEGGTFPNPKVYHYSSSCQHCENPACVANCPTSAMYKAEDGTVQHNDDECIGCKTCVHSCPYLVPQYDEELGIARKCDMCKPLTDKGQQPACVGACYTRSLEWGDYDELAKAHPGAVCDLPILPSSDITSPSILVDAKDFARTDGGQQKDY